MFEKLANIFRIPDLRKRILFTLALLAVYRLGGHIPTPGVNADKLAQFFEQSRGSFLGFVDLFSGGQLRRTPSHCRILKCCWLLIPTPSTAPRCSS